MAQAPYLYNRINSRELKRRMLESDEARSTLSFYRYVRIEDPAAVRDAFYAAWSDMGMLGRVYVAQEGVNAQVSLPDAQKERFIAWVEEQPLLRGIRLNWAVEDNGKSFFKLKVKVRAKLVADGLDDASFDPACGGRHLSAAEFNELSSRPETLVVDMRNHYESEVGHFEGAICPDVDTFRESLPLVTEMLAPYKDRPLIMYCTGGIRCEKASAWLRHQGFGQVYQLDGGIIQYARQVRELGLPNKFRGKNFVFDERLGESISGEVISHCHQCGQPADSFTNCRNLACNLLFIQCPACAEAHESCCSEACQHTLHLPEEEQARLRKRQGSLAGVKIFRKGRKRGNEGA
jgi:UPF0176 protein